MHLILNPPIVEKFQNVFNSTQNTIILYVYYCTRIKSLHIGKFTYIYSLMLSYSYIINCVCYYDGLFTIINIKRGTQKKINVQKKKKKD